MEKILYNIRSVKNSIIHIKHKIIELISLIFSFLEQLRNGFGLENSLFPV